MPEVYLGDGYGDPMDVRDQAALATPSFSVHYLIIQNSCLSSSHHIHIPDDRKENGMKEG